MWVTDKELQLSFCFGVGGLKICTNVLVYHQHKSCFHDADLDIGVLVAAKLFI